jgi:threonine dehydrogenase-like Zn-dependent dehydrogenase
LRIIGSNMSHNKDVQSALELATSGQVDVEAIATHLLSIDDAQRGMELAQSKDDSAIKVILSFEKNL